MKQKIKELNDYFISKIIAKDFRVKKYTDQVATIEIDGEYSFCIWIASVAKNLSQYEFGSVTNFMKLSFTPSEKEIIFNILKEGQSAEARQTITKQIEELQNELNRINKQI